MKPEPGASDVLQCSGPPKDREKIPPFEDDRQIVNFNLF